MGNKIIYKRIILVGLIQEASLQQTVNKNQADLPYFHSDKIHRT